MSQARTLVLAFVGMMIGIGFIATLLFDPVRSLEIRSAENDFKQRLIESGAYQRREAKLKAQARRNTGAASSRSGHDAALAAWYGESAPTGPSAAEGMVPSGITPERAETNGVSTAPLDQSFLINDTRPFGAPMIGPAPKATPAE